MPHVFGARHFAAIIRRPFSTRRRRMRWNWAFFHLHRHQTLHGHYMTFYNQRQYNCSMSAMHSTLTLSVRTRACSSHLILIISINIIINDTSIPRVSRSVQSRFMFRAARYTLKTIKGARPNVSSYIGCCKVTLRQSSLV